MPKTTLPHDDWLLTEALRSFEERQGRVSDDQAANRLAQRAGDDTAARLARRARALPLAANAGADLARLAVVRRRLIILALVLAALAIQGKTEILYPEHIDRGYDNLEEKLARLGAEVFRVRSF